MTYTNVFGGNTIYPSDVSYLALSLSAAVTLEWPQESSGSLTPAARIIDVTPASGGLAITLPDATAAGAGQILLFNNTGTNSFLVQDHAGGALATIAAGEQWELYLAGTATPAGVWRVFRFGASTATVQPSALAGYGLTVTTNTLSQSIPVTTFNNSPRSVLDTDRASALVWIGTGSGVVDLLSTVVAANNFNVSVRNSGGGDLTIVPAGSETIDGGPSLVLRPGDSASLVTDGLAWYSIGFGQQPVFAFDYTSVPVTGGTKVLSGSELNRIAYKFVGVLVADQYVTVPATVQQYWVDNATTGPFRLFLQTAGGTPIDVPQGARGIYYSDGVNVIDADTAGISTPISPADGGTGLTSYTVGDLLYASGPATLSRLADAAVGNALLSGGVGAPPAWGKVPLATHVSGVLATANGGTGFDKGIDGGSF